MAWPPSRNALARLITDHGFGRVPQLLKAKLGLVFAARLYHANDFDPPHFDLPGMPFLSRFSQGQDELTRRQAIQDLRELQYSLGQVPLSDGW